MKQIILLVSCLVLTIGVKGQDLKSADVPEVIKKSFEKKFPNTKVDSWEKEGADYEAEFHQNKVETSAIFDASGKFKELEEEIKTTDLPKNVIEYCAKTYVGYTLEEAAKIKSAEGKITYEAEMKKGKEHFDVMFDDKGNFAKKGDVETKKEVKD